MKAIRFAGAALFLALLAGCGGQQPAQSAESWLLVAIDGTAPSSPSVLSFIEDSRILGVGPCNLLGGRQEARWPRVSLRVVKMTDDACPAAASEAAFIAALGQMRRGEVSDGRMILSNAAGRQMVFTAVRAGPGNV